MAKKNDMSNRQKRDLRIRQLIFIGIAVIIILSMVISLFANV